MKKIIVSLVIGSAIGYCIRKMQDDGQFDCVCDSAQKLFSKSKKNVKNIGDIAKNEGEYLKDRVEDKLLK
ncbi:hypothetical protein [Dysgonomonas sp. ZJ709]|uniref:hypothetical protein n=1 Tax=Dysgonomonas sp. ZJ709 TaxID=2709797 RepID=UPI0013EC9C9C|nr:hypothetical protein [Dysgonomonas sp. ZJ709]